MRKMTSEEYVEMLRLKMLESAQGIIDKSVDIPRACVAMYEFLSEKDEYSTKIAEEDIQRLKLIWSDLYEFAQDEEQLKLTAQELIEFESKKKAVVEWYKKDLKDICQKILASDIIKMGPPPEDPLSWPYPDGI